MCDREYHFQSILICSEENGIGDKGLIFTRIAQNLRREKRKMYGHKHVEGLYEEPVVCLCLFTCVRVCAYVTASVRGRGSAGDLANVVTEHSMCVKVCVVCACANYQFAGQPGQQREGRHSNRPTLCQAVSMMVEQKNRMCVSLESASGSTGGP